MKSSRIFSKLNYFLLTTVLIGTFIFSAPPAQAQFGIVNDIWAGIRDGLASAWNHSGSILYQNVFGTAVKQIAYDTATWLGSGDKGQKPLFETKDLQSRVIDAGNSALGQFMEAINTPTESENGSGKIETMKDKNGKPLGGVNLCTPDLDILKRITLGIGGSTRPNQDAGLCDWQTLQSNWQTEFDMVNSMVEDGNFGKKLAKSLDPGANDVSVAQGLINASDEAKLNEALKVKGKSAESGRWLDVTNLISGKIISVPDTAKNQQNEARSLNTLNFAKTTGDIFVDAANIFLNQLALTAFNKLMSRLGEGSDNTTNLSNPYLQADSNNAITIENKARVLMQARFSDQTDYDILGELISCPNPDKPGPTNCVISSSFSTAISKKMTVINAINEGYLNSDYAFGFKGLNNEEPPYNSGYPYRSLVILRKYRVIPVGWELAAQAIQKNNKLHSPSLNTEDIKLTDLVNCFDPCDEYTGYNNGDIDIDGKCTPRANNPENWCKGLVDPNWVLKINKMYCKAKGFGPEIQNSSYNNLGKFCSKKTDKVCIGDCISGTPDKNTCCDGNAGEGVCETKTALMVTRNENYCADEQSCIKENNNGSCAYYGYCTEEKRRWVFNDSNNSECEPINNTCKTFTGNDKTASYLENTLDYSNCGANQVGCKQYATTGVYTPSTATTSDKMAWNASVDARYFNKNITDCDSSQEGCHEFIRTKDDLDTNLIADGSFENSKCIRGSGSTLLPNNIKDNKLINQANAQIAVEPCQLTTFVNAGAVRGGILDNRWFIDVPEPGSIKAGIVNDKASTGSQSLYINGEGAGHGGIYSNNIVSNLLPTGFIFEDDRFYTLSAKIYVVGHSNPDADKVKVVLGLESAETTGTDSWQSVTVIYYRSAGAPMTDFYIQGFSNSVEFYIDDLKLAVGENSTSYSEYADNNLIYEKLLPAYLEASCYISPTDYRLKDKTLRPAECDNYARKCNADEVGCELYTSINTGIDVTAKVKPKDVCPDSCVGYDVFVEQPTPFSAVKSAYFIPNTANQCSSQSVGCTAFTNLDKLDQGGEANEYYSYLRSCIKPDIASCGEFYTWEGSDDAGYQLRVFSLKKNTTNANEPASTMSSADEPLVCNETIFKKPTSDPAYNYDCREFYGRDGSVSYHLYTRTISCSDSCHPYRREVASAAECTSGGGNWDSTQSRCLYYSIPGEGTTCSAAEVGCREYTGNIANNVRDIFSDGFDPLSTTDPTSSWNGGEISNTALNLSEHSLLGTNISKLVGKYDTSVSPATFGVKQDESYSISFLAKSQSGSDVSIQGIDLINAKETPDSAAFSISNGTKIGNDWKIYTFNLDKLNHEVSPIFQEGGGDGQGSGATIGEKIRINFSAAVYIDNIILTEIPDRHFLITNSWSTPDECDQTITGDYALRYMLGCSQYKTSNNTTINLHSFSKLCQDSAAGCEQMIDTQNSLSYQEKIYNDTKKNGVYNGICDSDEPDCVKVPADKIINVAYDKTKQCGQENRGCQRFGLVSTYSSNTTYINVYKNNDPYNYGTVLCTANAVGCSEWSDNFGGTNYFKDPGDMVCEWRVKKGTEKESAWLKKQIKTCNGGENSKLCAVDSDCSTGQTCKLTGDFNCATSQSKTIGTGGGGNKVEQPTIQRVNGVDYNWAGFCVAEQAGCTEYIDPVSRFNNNLIYNPGYEEINGVSHAGWSNDGKQSLEKNVVEANTLYILKGSGATIETWGNNTLYQLNSLTNQFDQTTTFTPVTADPAEKNSTEFFIVGNNFDGFTVTGGATGKVELRKAIVGYQLQQSINKSPTFVDFKSGRVLFNERSVAGVDKKKLIYNADQTAIDGPRPLAPNSEGVLNANVILQVAPDRICDKWLACKSYDIDPNNNGKQTCFDVGVCNKLAANGECASFVDSVSSKNLISNVNNSGDFSNLTGYSKAGYVGNIVNADMYNLGAMKQVGATADFKDSFEDATNSWTGGTIVKKPSVTQSKSSSVGTLPDGKAYFKLSESEIATHDLVLSPNTTYVISAYIYNQTGSGKIEFLGGTTTPTISTDTKPSSTWLRETMAIQTGIGTNYSIKLSPNSGEVYFDDIRIETALNNRCTDSSTENACKNSKQYTASSCRLYPKSDSLACSYAEEDTNINQKGWRGYCLEWDPKNSQACLLWYPLDRIASDGLEDAGAQLLFTHDLYYCLDAKADCAGLDLASGKYPKLYCNQFTKVDKRYPWRTRLIDGSSYVVPIPSVEVNAGNAGGGKFPATGTYNIVHTPSPLITSSYYGALSADSLGNETSKLLISSGSIHPFLPYYGAGTLNNICQSFDLSTIQMPNAPKISTIYQAGFNLSVTEDGTVNSNISGNWDNCTAAEASYSDTDTPYRNCGNTTPGTKCNNGGGGPPKQIAEGWSSGSSGSWGIHCTRDTCVGCGATSKCGFYCYSKVIKYDAATDLSQANYAVERLFSKSDGQGLVWNGSSYSPAGGVNAWSFPTVQCANNQRPVYDPATKKCAANDGTCSNNSGRRCRVSSDCVSPGVCANPTIGDCLSLSNGQLNSTSDYCFVKPTVFNFRASKPAGDEVTGHCSNGAKCNRASDCGGSACTSGVLNIATGAFVTLKFNSKVDPDQLPLTEYIIDWDGPGGAPSVQTPVSIYDRPNFNSPHNATSYISYNSVSQANSSICGDNKYDQCEGKNCCVLKPTVKIIDNWGMFDQVITSPITIVITQ